MSPRVSILLPTHNKAGLLAFALRSVLAQSLQDFEVLIVGDGCTDHSAEVVRCFNDPRLIWYDLPKAPNFGYANRNLALREAKGEIIAFMAHDDLWFSDHLEQVSVLFENPRVEFAYSRPMWVLPRGMLVPGVFNLEYSPNLSFFLEVGNRIPAGCVLHRTECLARYGYWNDKLPSAGDWDMWKRIIIGGGKQNFAYHDVPTCLHFKADWHGDEYDTQFMFPAWREFFRSGQMPRVLQVEVSRDVSEQEAIWQIMSAQPAEWNNAIRSAVRQVIDLLAFQRISLDTELQAIYTAQQIIANELNTIKNSATWKLHEKLTGIHWLQKLYFGLKSMTRKLFSKTWK